MGASEDQQFCSLKKPAKTARGSEPVCSSPLEVDTHSGTDASMSSPSARACATLYNEKRSTAAFKVLLGLAAYGRKSPALLIDHRSDVNGVPVF